MHLLSVSQSVLIGNLGIMLGRINHQGLEDSRRLANSCFEMRVKGVGRHGINV
jgi:hypothetical protein